MDRDAAAAVAEEVIRSYFFMDDFDTIRFDSIILDFDSTVGGAKEKEREKEEIDE